MKTESSSPAIHTPGPLETREAGTIIAIARVGYMPHAEVFNIHNLDGGHSEPLTDTDRANATLFAASPDMLTALEAVEQKMPIVTGTERKLCTVTLTPEDCAAVRAAIAKAKGGAE